MWLPLTGSWALKESREKMFALKKGLFETEEKH